VTTDHFKPSTRTAETPTVGNPSPINDVADPSEERAVETAADLLELVRNSGLSGATDSVERIDLAIEQTRDDVELGTLYVARAIALQCHGSAAASAAAARNALPHLIAAGAMSTAAYAASMAAVFLDQSGEHSAAIDHAVDALVMLGENGPASQPADHDAVRAALGLSGFFMRISAFTLAVDAADRAFQGARLIDGVPIDALAYSAGYVAAEGAHAADDEATRTRCVEQVTSTVDWLRAHGIDDVSRTILANGLSAEVRHAQGRTSCDLGLDDASALYEHAAPDFVAWHQFVRGASAQARGDAATAIVRYDEALPGLEASSDNHCIVRALRGRARARADVGDFEGAYTDSTDLADRIRGWQIAEVGRLANQLARRADLERSATELRRTAARLSEDIDSDATTGVNSRRWLERRLDELADTDRSGSALMCDIDRFKSVNDSYGHHVGDDVLLEFGSLLRHVAGDADIARFGGEEFVVVLDDDDPSTGPAVAERLRVEVESHDWSHIAPGLHLTISCGVAYGQLRHVRSLLVVADSALLDAKHRGRNLVMTPSGPVHH